MTKLTIQKILLIVVFLFSFAWCPAQKDSIEFSLSTVSSMGKEQPEYYLECSITSHFKEDITVSDSLYEWRMFCLFLSPVRIEVEVLDSSCYRNRNPDCDPAYDSFERKDPVKVVKPNGKVEYRIRIDPQFIRRVNNMKEKKIIGFFGAYRLRVAIDYRISEKSRTSASRWMYIDFD